MINTQTEELAALYALNSLGDSEREAFERELAESVELRELVRELQAGLHAPARLASGPIRLDLLKDIHRSLGIDSETESEKKALFSTPARTLPWAYIWASAAALFLVMNLLLLFLVQGQADGVLLKGEASASQQIVRVDSSASEQPPEGVLMARITRLESELRAREADLQEAFSARAALEEENLEVKAYNSGWQSEYMRLASRFMPFFEPNDGMSRFTVIEMVDAQAFNTEQPRRGFAELAGRFLTEGGNIAGIGSGEFVGPVIEGADDLVDAAGANSGGLDPLSRGSMSSFAGSPESLEGVPVEEPTETLAMSEAAGFSVWRDDEQKGFLDLYNLPVAGVGEDAFLWVRSSELEPYLPVGYLPDLENGTGSLFYSVEEPNFTPTEILITAEDMAQPANQPSGVVLLRGP